MKRKKKSEKIDTTSMEDLSHNPFAKLGLALGVKLSEKEEVRAVEKELATQKPQLLVKKERRKGNKVVTVIYHLGEEAELRLKELKRKLATGGGLDQGSVILQGDQVEAAAKILQNLGYKLRKN